MDVLFLIGRIAFALVFLFSGATVHLLQARQGIAYARMYRVPAAALLVPLSRVMAVAGALSVILGIWADLGALLLVAFLLPVASSCTGSGGRPTSRRRATRWRTS
jgi:putative oxidoreductase